MNSHEPDLGPKEFWNQLAFSDRAVLLLDYDGTLAPFTPDRDRAYPWPGVRELLAETLRLDKGRTIFISGREAKAVARLLDLEERPEIWGVHGRERLFPDGSLLRPKLDPRVAEALERAAAVAADAGLAHCLEKKFGALALHWRGRPEAERSRLEALARTTLAELAARGGLELRPFDGGIELRSPTVTKGDAVKTVLAESRTDTVVAFMGDDHTDEDGFEALRGRGLGILVAAEPRPTAATLRLVPPAGILAFLRRWNDCLGG